MANRFTPGNVFWRGDWEYCPEYNIGDLVLRGGLFFLAIEHSAGMDPLDPLSAGYWLELGGGTGTILTWAGTAIDVSFARVASRAALPASLIPGRLYYVADEGVVVLDMGSGPEEYGGGNGMDYYRGAFATETDLIYAHPTDIEGAYAVVLSPTPTFWVWKTDRWVDTDRPATDFGVPPGGKTGQVLKKRSNADGDLEWGDESGGGGHVIEDEAGTAMPQQPNLQFVDFDVTDDPVNGRTVVSRNTKPQKPQNLSPYDGEYGVYQFAQFIGTNYEQSENIPMGAMQLQIATDTGFTNIVVDRTEQQAIVSITLEGTELQANETQYYWRIRYMTVRGVWSLWSNATSFHTESVFSLNVILTPNIIAPTEGGAASAINAILQSTPFAQAGEPTTHDASSWKINTARDGGGTDLWHKDNSATDLTSVIAEVDLSSVPEQQRLYAGVQHNGANGNKSKWSPFVSFFRRPYYEDLIIGIETTQVGNVGVDRRIGKDGGYVNLKPSYFNDHQIYALLTENRLSDGNTMGLIAPFYSRCEKVDNVFRWWMSPNPAPGFKIDLAFRAAMNGILRGKYITSAGFLSVPGVNMAQFTAANALSLTNDMNPDGVRGYVPSTFYVDMAMKKLMAIEAGTWNFAAVYGKTGSADQLSTTKQTDNSSLSIWRGFYGEWDHSSARLSMGYAATVPYSGNVPGGSLALSAPENPVSTPVAVPGIQFTTTFTNNGEGNSINALLAGYSGILDDDLMHLFTGVSAQGQLRNAGVFGVAMMYGGGSAHIRSSCSDCISGSGAGSSSSGYGRLCRWL